MRPSGAIHHLRYGEGEAAMKTVPALLFAALLFLVPAAAQTQPVETEVAGVTAEVVELRQTGGVLRLAVRFAIAEPRPRSSIATGSIGSCSST